MLFGRFFVCIISFAAAGYGVSSGPALIADFLPDEIFFSWESVRDFLRRSSSEALLWHIAAQSPRHYGVVPVRHSSSEALLWHIAAQSPRHYGVVSVRHSSSEALLWPIAAQSLWRNGLLTPRHEEVPGAGAQNGLRLCNMQHADGPISEKLFPPPIMMRDTTSLVPFF